MHRLKSKGGFTCRVTAAKPYFHVPLGSLIFALFLYSCMIGIVPTVFAANEGSLHVTSNPELVPAFNPAVSDYVVGGDPAVPVEFSVALPDGGKASIDGQPFTSGFFTSRVDLSAGQRVALVVAVPGSTPSTYHIRRLPVDFPEWTAERFGVPQAEWYFVAPSMSLTQQGRQDYILVFDSRGVPIWWYKSVHQPYDVKLMSDGHIGWTTDAVFEERRFDGSLVREIHPVKGALDVHEMILLPNGNMLLIENIDKGPFDLSAFGGPASARILDNIIEEIAPDGSLAWSWSSMENIDLSETDWTRYGMWLNRAVSDPYHMNAVAWDGDGYVASFRHLDAILKIDRATGEVAWKLGGSPRPDSLFFQGDRYGNFGGQHDSRILPDGSLTVYDNGVDRNRPPRAVRYRIDRQARTATLMEQASDPEITGSFCCGSARKLPAGNWAMSWGANNVVEEMTPFGGAVLKIRLGGFHSYRSDPLMPGFLDRSVLRAGMDAQYPRHPTALPASVAATVSSSPTPSVTGRDIILVATVVSSGEGTPTGAFQFRVDGAAVGEPAAIDTSGKATLALPVPLPGIYSVSGDYGGDARYLAAAADSVTHVVAAPCVPGDLDADGKVTVMDATLLLRAVARVTELNEYQAQVADLTRDSRFDIADAVSILRVVAGLIPAADTCGDTGG